MSGIFSAMTTAVSGLNAQSKSFDSVADNIANASTAGYKRTSVNFRDIVTSSGVGEISPGAVLANLRQHVREGGDARTTKSTTNVAISGAGFFSVTRPQRDTQDGLEFDTANIFTRRGDFEVDKRGYFVNGAGYYLRGYRVANQQTLDTIATLEAVRLENDVLPPRQTSRVIYNGNLPVQSKPLDTGVFFYATADTATPEEVEFTIPENISIEPGDSITLGINDFTLTYYSPANVGAAAVSGGDIANILGTYLTGAGDPNALQGTFILNGGTKEELVSAAGLLNDGIVNGRRITLRKRTDGELNVTFRLNNTSQFNDAAISVSTKPGVSAYDYSSAHAGVYNFGDATVRPVATGNIVDMQGRVRIDVQQLLNGSDPQITNLHFVETDFPANSIYQINIELDGGATYTASVQVANGESKDDILANIAAAINNAVAQNPGGGGPFGGRPTAAVVNGMVQLTGGGTNNVALDDFGVQIRRYVPNAVPSRIENTTSHNVGPAVADLAQQQTTVSFPETTFPAGATYKLTTTTADGRVVTAVAKVAEGQSKAGFLVDLRDAFNGARNNIGAGAGAGAGLPTARVDGGKILLTAAGTNFAEAFSVEIVRQQQTNLDFTGTIEPGDSYSVRLRDESNAVKVYAEQVRPGEDKWDYLNRLVGTINADALGNIQAEIVPATKPVFNPAAPAAYDEALKNSHIRLTGDDKGQDFIPEIAQGASEYQGASRSVPIDQPFKRKLQDGRIRVRDLAGIDPDKQIVVSDNLLRNARENAAGITGNLNIAETDFLANTISGGSTEVYNEAGGRIQVALRWMNLGGDRWQLYYNDPGGTFGRETRNTWRPLSRYDAASATFTAAAGAGFGFTNGRLDGGQALHNNVAFVVNGRRAVVPTFTFNSDRVNNQGQAIPGLTSYQDNRSEALVTIEQDGYGVGTRTGVTIDRSGYVIASYDNGQTETLFRIPLANFRDPDQMERFDGSAFRANADSGVPQFTTPGVGAGILLASNVEGSNVSITEEFAELIRAQRMTTANSRVVSTGSEMLAEVVNMKR
ncbi:MAG: flagellar hook-basal body complex protein [Pseudomonadota bacterium]